MKEKNNMQEKKLKQENSIEEKKLMQETIIEEKKLMQDTFIEEKKLMQDTFIEEKKLMQDTFIEEKKLTQDTIIGEGDHSSLPSVKGLFTLPRCAASKEGHSSPLLTYQDLSGGIARISKALGFLGGNQDLENPLEEMEKERKKDNEKKVQIFLSFSLSDSLSDRRRLAALLLEGLLKKNLATLLSRYTGLYREGVPCETCLKENIKRLSFLKHEESLSSKDPEIDIFVCQRCISEVELFRPLAFDWGVVRASRYEWMTLTSPGAYFVRNISEILVQEATVSFSSPTDGGSFTSAFMIHEKEEPSQNVSLNASRKRWFQWLRK